VINVITHFGDGMKLLVVRPVTVAQ